MAWRRITPRTERPDGVPADRGRWGRGGGRIATATDVGRNRTPPRGWRNDGRNRGPLSDAQRARGVGEGHHGGGVWDSPPPTLGERWC